MNTLDPITFKDKAGLSINTYRQRNTSPGNGLIFYQYPNLNASDSFAEFEALIAMDLQTNPDFIPVFLGQGGGSGPRYNMTLNIESGTEGIQLAVGEDIAYVRLYQPTGAPLMSFMVCNESIEFVSRDESERYLAVDYLTASGDGEDFGLHLPGDCVPVATASAEVRCYENVSAIDWSQSGFQS
ncbi:hypothetical protein B0T24DRAFT_722748 [Lasiosphaeria ovina]|uniref:Uncharacterized protein n=1 Tax=Lasiosphaeria ovina TaxID=92902 RepID=A0AAE0JZM9_9PEZI|nr:hypothetical protein B0T24DRAFT_722748 [Lasiosphaeria ovina]